MRRRFHAAIEWLHNAYNLWCYLRDDRGAIGLLEDHARLWERVADLEEQRNAMHRRAQAAEAGVGVTVEDCRRQGVSLGRTLANAGYRSIEEERDRLAQHAEALAQTLEEAVERHMVAATFMSHELDDYRRDYPRPADGRGPSEEAP